ncbi:hypothetical protein SAMN05444166_3957 [Singulisphaera sp. GP187]|nr:hypothetical protein SAMN05444166_3957 [Singulisphaera sp. GP187]
MSNCGPLLPDRSKVNKAPHPLHSPVLHHPHNAGRSFHVQVVRPRAPVPQELGLRRLESGVPGRADDGALGPSDTPLSHFRVERRKLSLSGLDESQEGTEGRGRTRKDNLATLAQSGHYIGSGGYVLGVHGPIQSSVACPIPVVKNPLLHPEKQGCEGRLSFGRHLGPEFIGMGSAFVMCRLSATFNPRP